MRRLLTKFFFRVRQRALKKQLKYEIENATKIAKMTGKTMLIFWVKGEYKTISKQEAKRMFKGRTNKEIENLSEIKIASYERQRQQGKRQEV